MRKWVVVCVLVLLAIGTVRPASAAIQSSCFENWYECNDQAGEDPGGFWWRYLLHLDCNVSLLGCLREALLG